MPAHAATHKDRSQRCRLSRIWQATARRVALRRSQIIDLSLRISHSTFHRHTEPVHHNQRPNQTRQTIRTPHSAEIIFCIIILPCPAWLHETHPIFPTFCRQTAAKFNISRLIASPLTHFHVDTVNYANDCWWRRRVKQEPATRRTRLFR